MAILDNLKKTAQNVVDSVSKATQGTSSAVADSSAKTAKAVAGHATKVYNSANQAVQKVGERVKEFKVEDIVSNLKIYEKYFSESKLWQKLEKFGKSIGATVLFPVLLLFNLLKSGELELADKAKIIGTLGYFILPVDLLPDAIAGVGYTDDAAALLATLATLVSSLTDEIQQLSKEQLASLMGEFDDKAIDVISKIISL